MGSRTHDVTKSRQKAQESGRKRLSAMLTPEGSELYERLKDRYPSERALIEAALSSLAGANALTDAEILDLLRARLARG